MILGTKKHRNLKGFKQKLHPGERKTKSLRQRKTQEEL